MTGILNCKENEIKPFGQENIMLRQLVISQMRQFRNIYKSRQKNQEKKIQEVPLYSGPVNVLATPPFGASSNIALWRAKIKLPVELVVADRNL